MTPSDSAVILRARAAAAVMGAVEDCYGAELVRAMALATLDGHKSDVLKIYERLQAKYKKDFKTSLLKEMVKEELARLRAAAPTKAVEGWERDLIRKPGGFDGEPGKPLPCEHNALLYARNHPEFAGSLAWDEFRSEFSLRKDVPALTLRAWEPVKDVHIDRFQIWLQNETGARFSGPEALTGMRVCAADNTFHPVKEYLEGLPPWDGVSRSGSPGTAAPVPRKPMSRTQPSVSTPSSALSGNAGCCPPWHASISRAVKSTMCWCSKGPRASASPRSCVRCSASGPGLWWATSRPRTHRHCCQPVSGAWNWKNWAS